MLRESTADYNEYGELPEDKIEKMKLLINELTERIKFIMLSLDDSVMPCNLRNEGYIKLADAREMLIGAICNPNNLKQNIPDVG